MESESSNELLKCNKVKLCQKITNKLKTCKAEKKVLKYFRFHAIDKFDENILRAFINIRKKSQ